jgi:integrase/recombinase XerD
MSTAAEIAEFRRYLAEDRRATKNTVVSYMRDLNMFADYLASLNIRGCRSVTEKDVRSYIGVMKSSGKSAATATRSVAALKRFFSYMQQTGAIRDNPAANIPVEPAEKKPPQILTGGDVELLLRQPDGLDRKGVRDKAMLELLYATGVRVSEFTALNIDDVNMETGLMRCGEQGRGRLIPVYPTALAALDEYISDVRPGLLANPGERALFVNMNGERMSRQGFWKIVKGYREKAGIDKDITPQTLRHSFAAHLLENGADLRALQELLGHSDVSTTSAYTRFVKKPLRDVYELAHPKA